MPYTCPTPSKARYATHTGAEQGAHRANLRIGESLYPYECGCSWWHLTKTAPAPAADPATATRPDVEALAAATEADFRAATVYDATARADPGQRSALRHHTNLSRWKKHLGMLLRDVDQQLARRSHETSLAAHDWRRRTLGYRDVLRQRLTECKRLRAAEHTVMTAHRAESRRRDLEAAQRAGASVKELRAKAGELAVARLIDAHGTEFALLLREAYDAVGLSLPENVARHLPGQAAA